MGEMAFPRCTLKWTQHGDDITYFFFWIGDTSTHSWLELLIVILVFAGCGNKGVQFVSSSKWFNDGRFWLQYQCEVLMKIGVELSADLKERLVISSHPGTNILGKSPQNNTISRWMFHSFEIISSFPKFFFRRISFHFFWKTAFQSPQNRNKQSTRVWYTGNLTKRHQQPAPIEGS